MEEYLKPVPEDQNIAVLLSGGLDSALLLWALGMFKRNSYVILTGIRSDDSYYNKQNAIDVVKWIKNNTSINIVEHEFMSFADREEGKRLRGQHRQRVTNQYNITKWINGKTCNPDIDLGEGRDTTRDTRHNQIEKNNIIQPFANIDKSQIAKWYKEYELMKNLYPLTVSCESKNPPRPCGECWWCKEREWAFGLL